MARCGCNSTRCSCLIVAGDGVTVEGSGSPGTPFVISATGGITVTDTPSVDLTLTGSALSADVLISADLGNGLSIHADGLFAAGGGGGCTVVSLTLAAIQALRTAGTLDTCTQYVVTDWVSGTGSLPGPNELYVRALEVDQLSPDVLVRTPIGDFGPSRGTYSWDASLMTYMEDPLNNRVHDIGVGTIDAFPWGNSNWTGNELHSVTFTGGFAGVSSLSGGSQMGNTYSNAATFDFSAGGSINIIGSIFNGSSVSTDGGSVTVQRSTLQGDQVSTNGGTITIDDGDSNNSTVQTAGADCTLFIIESNLLRATISANNSTPGASLIIQECQVSSTSSITDNTSGAGGGALVGSSVRDLSSVVFAGAGLARTLQFCSVHSQSTIDVATNGGSPTTAADSVEVGGRSILDIAVGGDITASRISFGASLDTGNFSHNNVIIDGAFSTTLTAANTNTLQNKSFSDVI